jgi:hypothetical protein
MDSIVIKVFPSWCSSQEIKDIYEKIFEVANMSGYGKDKQIYITNEDDYSHAIILNTAMPVLKNIPKENVIGLAYEPPIFLGLSLEFVEYAQKYISKYYMGNKYDLPEPFVEGYSYMSFTLPPSYLPPKNNNTMSIMVSKKGFAPGHKYRHLLVQRILSTNLPIDIYGNGCDYYKEFVANNSEILNQSDSIFSFLPRHRIDRRIKGEFVDIEPYSTYDFHICVENFRTSHYFSEKIINPLLCSSTPVYWGCENIDSYFPGNAIILTGSVDTDMEIIKNVLLNPAKYKKHIDVDSIKNKMNLLKNLDKLFPALS